MRKNLLVAIIAVIVLLGVGGAVYYYKFYQPVPPATLPPINLNVNQNVNQGEQPKSEVKNFEECVAAGNPVMESYPRQCRAGDKTFTEDIGNELEKTDLIRIDSPRPNAVVASPLEITGQARGTWYFEASFPIKLLDGNGNVLAQTPAQSQGEWMTEDFVPFEATLEFSTPATDRGTLILEKDNPSGLPEHEDSLILPVRFR